MLKQIVIHLVLQPDILSQVNSKIIMCEHSECPRLSNVSKSNKNIIHFYNTELIFYFF